MARRPHRPPERDLQDAAEFIRRSFHRRPTLPDIAQAAHLSPFHLQRVFSRQFGESPYQMVARLQIDLAKELMLRGVRLADVARRCGFSQQSHFTHRFRMATGTTPARWLQRESGGPQRTEGGTRNGGAIRPTPRRLRRHRTEGRATTGT